MRRDATDWVFDKMNTDEDKCVLVTLNAGTYTFTLNSNWVERGGNWCPQVSVTYPEATFAASFEKPNEWTSTLKAYVWTEAEYGNPKVEQLGGWSGTAATNNAVSFAAKVPPANIIWNNNGSNTEKTEDLPFVNGMTYDVAGNKKYVLSLTENVWTSFCPAVNVTIPSDARLKVYKAQLVGTTLTAYEITGNIKAGEGVLLKANTTASNYTFVETDDEVDALENNSLKGTSIRNLRTTLQGNETYLMVLASGTNTFKSYTADYLPANKAYILYTPIQGAPSIISLVEEENNTTNINNIEYSEEAVKFFQNGKLFINKNGIVYDALGRIVK